MPIRPAEPRLFPDDLLTSARPGSVAEWRVLHTKPRQEKSLARDLLGHEIGFYLPVIRGRRATEGRSRPADLPLFDGYLFLFADRDQYHAALATRRVVRSLAVADQAAFGADLRRLHEVLASGLPVTPESTIRAGQSVEITDGPLAGLRGKVVRAATGVRFVVAVDFIGRGASVMCDGFALRPIAGAD